MHRSLLIGLAVLAIAGAADAAGLSGVPCPPGGTAGVRDDEYMIDDGVGETSIGLGWGGTFIWLNQFQAHSSGESIQEVGVAWGDVVAGRPAEILIFGDPDNDGNPQDLTPADLLASAPVTSEGGNDDTIYRYDIDATLQDEGDYFFIGVCCSHVSGEYPARLDQTTTASRSWAGGDYGSQYDCANPNGGGLGLLTLIDDHGYPGNWMVRASSCVIQPGAFGACCLPDGSCVDTYAVNCGDWLHGIWQACTSCGSVDCPDVEACCLPGGSCQMLAAFGCEDLGGEPQGPGTQCEPTSPCAPSAVDETNWGRVKQLYR